MQVGAVEHLDPRLFGFGHLPGGPLLRDPPAPGFHRVLGIDDVDDAVDVADEPRGRGGEMHVAAAVVEEPVDAQVAAGLEVTEELGIHRVLDVPDVHAFLKGVVRLVAVEEGDPLLQGRDHEAVGHLYLRGHLTRLVGTGNELQVLRFAGVGDVQDRPAAVLEVSQIEVVPAVDHLHGHLEARPSVQIVVAEHFDVLCEGFLPHESPTIPQVVSGYVPQDALQHDGCAPGCCEFLEADHVRDVLGPVDAEELPGRMLGVDIRPDDALSLAYVRSCWPRGRCWPGA